MKKLYIFFFVAGLIITFDAKAQQDPQYTQYMYNMNVVNPAYSGSKDGLSIGLLYRNQWNGFDGAPETYTFSAHMPVGGNVGLGLSAISDKAGPVTETNAYADVSYTLELGGESKLAFGVKAGATFYDVGLTSLELQDDDDIAFSQNINDTYPNFGAGFLYYTDKFYFGVSVPNILSTTHIDIDGREFGVEEQHFFGTAGYVFQINENLKLKPSTLVKSSFGEPISFDANLNALFYNRFEIGVSYRLEDAVSVLASVRATDWLQIGVAYDNSISDIDEPSYEAFVLFNIGFSKKTYVSPRYF